MGQDLKVGVPPDQSLVMLKLSPDQSLMMLKLSPDQSPDDVEAFS